MKLHKILVVAMCAALPAIAYSDDDKVLKGREITESALIDALTPEAGATQTRRMRSIRVGPDMKATPTPVAKQASASLLRQEKVCGSNTTISGRSG